MSIFIKGLAIAVVALAIDAGAAHAAGRGGISFGAGGWHGATGWHGGGWRGHRGRIYGRGYYGGGVVADDGPSTVYVEPVYIGPPQPTVPLVAPALALTCGHRAETVTVPSEDGGDRQIRITRC